MTSANARDPDTKYPLIRDLRPPGGTPNLLIVLLDVVGFGASSVFGGRARRRTSRSYQLEFKYDGGGLNCAASAEPITFAGMANDNLNFWPVAA